MTDKTYIDIEPTQFGVSRSHEYEFQVGPYQWSYFTRIDRCITDIGNKLQRLKAFAPQHDQVICLGHHNNFRYGVLPSYKSNRLGIRKAAGYKALREWIEDNYETLVFPNVEADDVIGLMAGKDDIIFSPDKDLKTIKGWHMDNEGTLTKVTELEANRSYFKQVLHGDAADGYMGCPGIGNKSKIFEQEDWITCCTEAHFWDLVKSKYQDKSEKLRLMYDIYDPMAYCLQIARVARILRPGEYDHQWDSPVLWEGPG